MRKVKHIFTRRTAASNFVVVRQAITRLPADAEGKLKQMGEDYDFGDVFKKTWSNGEVDMGFGAGDTGTYRVALPGERIKRYEKIDYDTLENKK